MGRRWQVIATLLGVAIDGLDTARGVPISDSGGFDFNPQSTFLGRSPMKQSLVTGGAGFIGSHLVEALLARGDRVAVIDDESTGTRANLAAVIDHPRLHYVQGSVADRDLVRGMLDGVDEVYHLAAAVGVRLIAESPIHTIETNVYPMELLLDELGRLQAAGRSRPIVPGQHQRSLRQESQAGLV